MHKRKAFTILNLVANQDEDKFLETDKVAMQIKSEINNVSGIKDKYPVLDENSLIETILPTLRDVLVAIFPKLKDSPESVALISSIVATIASVQGVLCFKLLCDCLSEKRKSLRICNNME